MPERSVQPAAATRSIRTSLRTKCGQIMKAAVDRLYTYLLLKENDKAAYEALLTFGARYTAAWDEPILTKAIKGISDSSGK